MSAPDSAESCPFCGIAAGSVPADVVHDSDRTIAFRDLRPQAPTHVLVIPREHHADVGTLAAADPDLLAEVMRATSAVAAAEGLAESGYRVVFNTGRDGGQTVFHVHAHVLGGRRLSWPPG